MSGKDLLKLLKKNGWSELPRKGTSHVQLKHEVIKGKITVAVHSGKDIPIGTLNAILKQAGLK